MNIYEIKRTMIEKGVPAEVISQFVFPETDAETPEEKVEFARQMDRLLTKDQILTIMAGQGCGKKSPPPNLCRNSTANPSKNVLKS